MSTPGTALETMLAETRAKLRELRGDYSPRAWAVRLGTITGFHTSHNTVLRQERGETGLDAAYVLAVAEYSGCTLSWLLGDEGPKYIVAPLVAESLGETQKLPGDVASALEAAVEELFSERAPARRREGDVRGLRMAV